MNLMAGCLLGLLTLAGEGLLDRVELKLPGRVITVVVADVGGDGQNDLLVFWRQGYPPDSVSRLSVYRSLSGRIDKTPHQVLALPEKTVAFDVGDVDADGRVDVLLLRSDGVWALEGTPNGKLDKTPRPVVKVMTVAAFPHEDNIPRISLLADLGKNRQGLLIPTVPIGPLALYTKTAAGKWSLSQILRVPARTNLYTSAEDFRATREYGALFQITFPRHTIIDQDGDGNSDLLFFSLDSVAVFRARPDGSFPAEPDLFRNFNLLESKERIHRGAQVRAVAGDVNGDGRADLLFNKTVGGISNMRSELRLYLANQTSDYPRKPDLVSARDGWGSSASFVDVNSDKRKDLLRPHVKMGLTALIGMMLAGKLEVDFEVYLSKNGSFEDKADFSLPSKLRINFASNQELTGPYPNFAADFNADGIGDLIIGKAGGGSGDNPDRLEIRPGLGHGKYSDTPIWQTDLNGTRYIVPFCIQPRKPPGLLIYFSNIEDRHGDIWVLHNSGRWK